jgi:hypothetical protein
MLKGSAQAMNGICRIAALLLAGTALICGCSKSAPPPPAQPNEARPEADAPATTPAEAATPPASAASSSSESDVTARLSELTQAVRKFSAEKQRVPSSLEEVAGAGYIAVAPPAPAGKKFAVDTKRLSVILVNH